MATTPFRSNLIAASADVLLGRGGAAGVRHRLLGAAYVVLLGVIGLELGPWSSSPPPPAAAARPIVTAPIAADAGPSPERLNAWASTILDRPLFSENRKPPAQARVAVTTAGAVPLPRLAGVLISATDRHAIFAAAQGGKPTVADEGGQVAGFTVRSISADQVVLAGPQGSVTMHPAFDTDAPQPAPVFVPERLPMASHDRMQQIFNRPTPLAPGNANLQGMRKN